MKIKITLLSSILLFVFTSAVFAQKGFWLEGSVEIKGSMGGDYFVPTDILFDSSVYVSMHTAFTPKITVAATAGYNINERFGASIGIGFSMLGQEYYNYNWNYYGYTIDYKRNVSLNYLQAPVQIYYTHSPAKKVSLIVTAGGYAAMLVSYQDENKIFFYDGSVISSIAEGKNLTQSVSSGTIATTINATLKEEPYIAYDYGAILGVGIRVKLSEKKYLTLMPQYSFGFASVKNKTSEIFYQNQTYLYWEDTNHSNLQADYNNSSIGLKIGLRFN